MGGKLDPGELLTKLRHANESDISEILASLGIGWYDSQIVERFMYHKSIQERIGIIQELIISSPKYKQCMEHYILPNSSEGKQ